MKTTLQKEDFSKNGLDPNEVSRINRYFQHYRSKRETWAKRGKEYEEVVFCDVEGTGTMYTVEQLNKLRKEDTIPISMSIGIAFIEQLQSFLTASKPSITVIPIGDSSKIAAYINRDIVTALLYLNDFQEKLEQAIQDQEIVGNGYLFVTFPNFFTTNAFRVIITDLDWKTVYLDPMSTRRDAEDCEMQFICTPMLKSKAKKIYNLTDEDMKFVDSVYDGFDAVYTEQDFTFVGDSSSDDYLVWVMEVYEKVFATLYILQDGTKTFEKPKGASVDANGQPVDLVMNEVKNTFIKRTIKIGNLIKDSRILPITMYPIVKYTHTHRRTPYGYGVMHHIIDLIHALEKCLLLTFQNAQVASNSAMIAPEGSIDNKEEFKTQRSTVGGVITYNTDPVTGNKPEQLMPLPLNNAWYTLTQQLIKLIEYVTGIYDLMQGNSENAPQTLGATQSIQSFGTQRPKMYARRIDIANKKLGELLIQFYQAFSPQENIIRYISGTETMNEIITNVSARINQETGEGQPHPLGQDKMSIVIDEANNIIRTYIGDISVGEFQVRFQSSNDLPTTRSAVLQILQGLMNRMGDDAMAVSIAQMAMKLMDYPELDKIGRDVDVIKQLQGQVQQLGEQLTETQKELIKTKHELESEEKKVVLLQFENELDKQSSEAKRHIDKLSDNVKEEIAAEKKAENKDSAEIR